MSEKSKVTMRWTSQSNTQNVTYRDRVFYYHRVGLAEVKDTRNGSRPGVKVDAYVAAPVFDLIRRAITLVRTSVLQPTSVSMRVFQSEGHPDAPATPPAHIVPLSIYSPYAGAGELERFSRMVFGGVTEISRNEFDLVVEMPDGKSVDQARFFLRARCLPGSLSAIALPVLEITSPRYLKPRPHEPSLEDLIPRLVKLGVDAYSRNTDEP